MSYNPIPTEVSMVWAIPVSLTATQGISFDFSSSGYLDVSVPLVCLPFGITGFWPAGFPHSEIPGSKLDLQLAEAYRSYSTSFIASGRQGIPHVPLVT